MPIRHLKDIGCAHVGTTEGCKPFLRYARGAAISISLAVPVDVLSGCCVGSLLKTGFEERASLMLRRSPEESFR